MKNIFLFIILSILIYSSNCKKRVSKKKEAEKFKNVCDEEDRSRPLVCFCKNFEDNLATEATCWVYNEKLAGDDPVWDAFETQNKLEKLKFNIRPDGTLLSIPTNALKYLKRLQTLEIHYALISDLTPYTFSNLSSLTDISIPRSFISNLHKNSISFMPNLVSLNLDENKISEIKRGVFYAVPSLKMLFVNQNNLSIIHDFAFENLHRLEELELNGNQISIITKETFAGLRSLKMLSLRLNRLTMLGDHTFSEMPNLYELDLDQNNIEYVSEKALAGLKKLSKLRMGENQLKSLDENVFKETINLSFLDLRSNGLEVLTFEILEPLWDNMKNISSNLYLEKNRLKCDCRLSWVYSLRNETHNSDIRNSLEELTCVTDDVDLSTINNANNMVATEKSFVNEEPDYRVDVNSVQYDDDVDYDEEQDNSEYDLALGALPRKHIFDIPIEKLPCPEKLKATTEDIFNSKVVNSRDNNSSSMCKLSLHLIVSISFLRTVFFR